MSLLSVAMPVWVNWRMTLREERQSQEATDQKEIEAIDEAALELLGHVVRFQHTDVGGIVRAYGGNPSIQECITSLKSGFYLWESRVWGRLADEERKNVVQLRRRFEDMPTPTSSGTQSNEIASATSELTDTILTVTRSATQRR